MPFGTEKLEWRGYQTVKKLEDIIIRFDKMYERDGHTHTPHDGIGRVCIASPGKNHDFRPISHFISQMMQDRPTVTTEGE